MREQSLYGKFKSWIAGVGFRVFIWGNETTEEEYWEQVYEQEKQYKQQLTSE